MPIDIVPVEMSGDEASTQAPAAEPSAPNPSIDEVLADHVAEEPQLPPNRLRRGRPPGAKDKAPQAAQANGSARSRPSTARKPFHLFASGGTRSKRSGVCATRARTGPAPAARTSTSGCGPIRTHAGASSFGRFDQV